MEPFRSILVDVDASAPIDQAFERSVRLARRTGARMTVVDVMSIPGYARRQLPPDIEEQLVADKRRALAALAESATGISAESKLLFGRPATALIREVLASGHDLLVRSHDRDRSAPETSGLDAVDMELLRECPCPLLLSRRTSATEHPRIVGAVNAVTDDAAEQELNARIAMTTRMMAELEDGMPMLLHAWAPFAEGMIRTRASDTAFAGYVDSVRQRAASDAATLVDSVGGSPPLTAELRRGKPEDVIPEFVVSEAIDLVVMGTVARTGIAGLLIGNTAERVLHRLPCSVMAVKPAGFVSPVRE